MFRTRKQKQNDQRERSAIKRARNSEENRDELAYRRSVMCENFYPRMSASVRLDWLVRTHAIVHESLNPDCVSRKSVCAYCVRAISQQESHDQTHKREVREGAGLRKTIGTMGKALGALLSIRRA